MVQKSKSPEAKNMDLFTVQALYHESYKAYIQVMEHRVKNRIR